MMVAWLAGTAALAGRSAGELLRDVEHLQVVGSVLYVAAHPDDENTRLIAWLEGQRGVRTAYLSMTRGGGGQNLIGLEQDDLLGVVRTGELLAARRLDGAEQYFTRTRDFGYSKSSEETLALWGHDEALADVVRAIRTFRPDVIVTRFPTTGETHGHHLASAILAGEAFVKAADPAYVTPGLQPWAADRLLHNRSSWSIDPTTDTSAWVQLDVGTYDPRIGQSYGEVAAASRTMHKSQGFGSEPELGPQIEYFVPTAGTALAAGDDLLEGLELTWARFEGTRKLAKTLQKAATRFDAQAPHEILPQLVQARAQLELVPDAHWRELKRAEIDQVIADCVGLWLAARATQPAVAPGGELEVTLTALQRAPAEVSLRQVTLSSGVSAQGAALAENSPWTSDLSLTVPQDTPYSRPHWLDSVEDEAVHIQADTPAALQATFELVVGGQPLTVVRPVEFAWTDPVQGERSHPVEVLPAVTATFSQRATMIPSGSPATSRLTLRATSGPAEGVLRLQAPDGLTVQPAEIPFALAEASAELGVEIVVQAAVGAAPGPLRASVEVGGRQSALQQTVVDHPHLPRRTVLAPAVQTLVPLELQRGQTARIGYVAGSGDSVADGLRAVGYAVEELSEQDLAAGQLSRFDAIVMGIRAYNTHPRLLALHGPLMAYVADGGRLLVQYNTNNRFDPLQGEIGPWPFQISRARVTDETAEMLPTDPAHPALLSPNKLGPQDFAGWVQERGLYFADAWDPSYEPLFSAHDPGEEPLLGSTLLARHGEGVFVYTGLSFFRQLPAGVPGAYRLLANLLAVP
jgi:LmbE family N-acetylglucosaminyl deacetylase